METYRNDYFVCSLSPGDYKIETDAQGAQFLYWYDDQGTRPIDIPEFEPEYRHLVEIPLPAVPPVASPIIRRRDMPKRRPVELPTPSEPEPLAAPEAIKPQRRPIKAKTNPPKDGFNSEAPVVLKRRPMPATAKLRQRYATK